MPTLVLFTQSEVAETLGVSRQRVAQLVEAGRLSPTASRPNGTLLFTHEDVQQSQCRDKVCPTCDKEFLARSMHQKYCCEDCYSSNVRKLSAGYMQQRNAQSQCESWLSAWVRLHLKSLGRGGQIKMMQDSGVRQPLISAMNRGKGYVNPKGYRLMVDFLKKTYPDFVEGEFPKVPA